MGRSVTEKNHIIYGPSSIRTHASIYSRNDMYKHSQCLHTQRRHTGFTTRLNSKSSLFQDVWMQKILIIVLFYSNLNTILKYH